MDPEQTYLRVHARLSGMLSQLLTPGIRMALEFMYFTFAVAIFVLLFVMHANFVQQPGCASELSGVKFGEAQLVQIKIATAGLWTQTSSGWNSLELQSGVLRDNTGSTDIAADGFTVLSTKFWSNWFGSGSRRSKLIFKSWKNDKELLVPAVEKTSDITITKTIEHETNSKMFMSCWIIIKPCVTQTFMKMRSSRPSLLYLKIHFLWTNFELQKRAGWYAFLDFLECLRLLRFEDLKSLPVQYLEKKSRAIEPAYLYTTEKGYFLLPEVAKSHHNIQTVNITISAQSSCFGNRWQQLLINVFVGYDTILMNTLLSSPGHGYLYNYQTKEFYDLSYGQEASNGPTRFGVFKFSRTSSLIMSLFVFFTITMSVSFTLRETQSRMLRFTVQLQHHARNHLPTFQLIFVHVIESLVFVPIMIGILFFLFEFYDDQLLAILVLTLVWLCELFTMISVRTTISMQFFPRFFLLYFLVFHIYFFSYPYGFSYVAFSAMAAFMQHLILYFWNRFEVPALQRFMRTRTQLQHQTGVQITSSAIYTSTFHIARVSIPNRNPFGTEPTIATAETPASNVANSTESKIRTSDIHVFLLAVNVALQLDPKGQSIVHQEPCDASDAVVLFLSLLFKRLGSSMSSFLSSFPSQIENVTCMSNVYNQMVANESAEIKETGESSQDDPSMHQFSITPYISPKLTPTTTPKGSSTNGTPIGFSTIRSSPIFLSGATSPTTSQYGEHGSMSPLYASSQQSSTASSPPHRQSLPGRNSRTDGKELFRQARIRLSYEQFAAFLANVKEFNAHRQSSKDTLAKADKIFGTENKDLYFTFQSLLESTFFSSTIFEHSNLITGTATEDIAA
ncbi:hypothetical protein ZIOFF_039012 [Zingiber officinale]|uniref:At4g15545-like C-terminal domain-containing protein n=1 Tax=Zingiber officinale TaxID=94328 RepID=A0A8J5L3G4_ZINOF|nr:hypothetical protein ZIOFF_039012 [Zingiber officinale]